MSDGIACAVADVRRGCIELLLDPDGAAELTSFAFAASELFACDRTDWAHVGVCDACLCEIVIVAPPWVHVAQRLPWRPGHALLTVGRFSESFGVVIAAARARLRSLEQTE